MPKVLFLIPPFDLPTHPYPGAVQLVVFLRSMGIETDCLDLNIAFYHWAVGSELMETARSIPAIGSALTASDVFLRGEEILTSVSIQYRGFGNPYSSSDILRAICQASAFDRFFHEYLPSVIKKDYTHLCVSIPFPAQIEPAFRMIRSCRELLPHARVIAGGSAVGMHLIHTEEPEFFKMCDFMVAGDGEEPLLALINGTYDDVPGVASLKNGRIHKNPRRSCTPIDSIPTPEAVFDRSMYMQHGHGTYLRMGLSRGCSWGRCMFCNIKPCGLLPHQTRGIDSVMASLKAVASHEDLLCFTDDETPHGMLHEMSLRILDGNIKGASGGTLQWTAQVRAHPDMTLQWAGTLKKAGCHTLFMGVESFCDRVLRVMGKPQSAELIERCLGNLAWAGIGVVAYMIAGTPTETEDEALESFGRLKNLLEQGVIRMSHYNHFALDPYSPAAACPEKYGIGKIDWPPGCDLRPWAMSFEHTGMSFRLAVELQTAFEAEIMDIVSKRER